jgi:hypothetical protein
MSAVHPDACRQAVVEAVLVLLERMGLSPADLAAVPQPCPEVPTFAEYVPVVPAAVSAGTRKAYGSYWNRVLEHRGGRRLDEPAPSEIRQLMAYVKTHVARRRNARGGRSAQEHLAATLRCLYQRAVDDGLIAEADNPARKVAQPRRLPTTRRALPDTRLAQINEVAATTRVMIRSWTRCCRGCTPRPLAAAVPRWRCAQPTSTPASAYAGHTDSGSEAGATATYVLASLPEVAAALAALTGEPHPLATTEGW